MLPFGRYKNDGVNDDDMGLNSSTIGELEEWCLKWILEPRVKSSRTCRVSMTTV